MTVGCDVLIGEVFELFVGEYEGMLTVEIDGMTDGNDVLVGRMLDLFVGDMIGDSDGMTVDCDVLIGMVVG